MCEGFGESLELELPLAELGSYLFGGALGGGDGIVDVRRVGRSTGPRVDVARDFVDGLEAKIIPGVAAQDHLVLVRRENDARPSLACECDHVIVRTAVVPILHSRFRVRRNATCCQVCGVERLGGFEAPAHK